MGVPSRLCAVRLCANAGCFVHNLGVALARLPEAMVCYRRGICGVGVALPPDLCHAPPTLTLAHPNPSPSVNELEEQLQAVCCWRGACVLVKGW